MMSDPNVFNDNIFICSSSDLLSDAEGDADSCRTGFSTGFKLGKSFEIINFCSEEKNAHAPAAPKRIAAYGSLYLLK